MLILSFVRNKEGLHTGKHVSDCGSVDVLRHTTVFSSENPVFPSKPISVVDLGMNNIKLNL